MRFEVRERDTAVAIVDDLASALDVVRSRHEGASEEELNFVDCVIVKRDARGRVRRTLSGTELFVHLREVPVDDLFRSFTWARFDAAVAVGRDFVLLVTPEDERRPDGWWQLRLRYTRADTFGEPIPKTLYLSRSSHRGGLDPHLHEAERRLTGSAE